MAAPSEQLEEVGRLTGLLLEGALGPDDRRRLEALLLADPATLEYYQDYVDVHCLLHWQHGASEGSEFRAQGSESRVRDSGLGIRVPGFPESPTPSPEPRVPSPESPAPSPESLTLPIVIDTSSTIHYPLFTIHSPLGGWLFSYAAATVLTALAILGAWAYKVTVGGSTGIMPVHVVDTGKMPVPPSAPELVGQVTGTVDCHWADPQNAPSAAVRLGGKYALASGLLEISYDSGARVILQGPCSYEVESARGGFLALGKLTARVDSGQWPVASEERSEVRGQGSEHYPLSTSHYPLFAVRTPTALVTDLGTEFGVEVDRFGTTRSLVFRGKVEVLVAGGGREGDRVIPLEENESATVAVVERRAVAVTRGNGRPTTPFVRQLPKWEPIKLWNTGVGLKEGEADPHWQLVARSDQRHFKPRPALVAKVAANFLANDPARSQWISAVADMSDLPDDVVYTFRTTFDLAGARPDTAILRGKFLVDNHVDAIRLNGHDLDVPDHDYGELTWFDWTYWYKFQAAGGFVAGTNVLEIDVYNGDRRKLPGSPMAFRVELEGQALGGGAAASAPTPAENRRREGRPMNGP